MKISFAGAIVVCASLVATGASADSLVVTYSVPGAAAVPTLTEWAMIILGLTLAAAAVLSLRDRRFGGTAAFGLAALLSFAASDAAQAQRADLSLNLDGSGSNALTFVSDADSLVTVTNTSGQTATFSSIETFSSPGVPSRDFRLGSGATCRLGESLAPGDRCGIPVNYFNPP